MSTGIIGAGWAGLAAAIELTRAGQQVTIYETGKVLGGRARRLAKDGPALDNGQHLLAGAYADTLRLMEFVAPGSSQTSFLRLPLTLDYPEGVRIRAPRLPAPLHLAYALLFARGLSLKDKLAALRFMQSLEKTGFDPEKPLTVAEALVDQPAAIRRYLWEPICIAALNTPVKQASFRVFARVLKDALMGKAGNSNFLIPAQDLSTLFPDPAAAWLENNGGKVLDRTRITALESVNGQWKVQWDNGEATHEQIIIATSPAHAIPLLEQVPECQPIADKLKDLEYQPIVTVYAEYPANLNFSAPLLGWVDPVPLFVFDLNTCRPDIESSGHLIAVVASAEGAHIEWDDARWMDEIHARMEQAFGKLPEGQLIKRITEKRATFSCAPDVFRPDTVTPRPGLYLAGDYLAGPYPSTIEGAVRSGVQCTKIIVASS